MNQAPPIQAPKQGEKYWKFDPVPQDGMTVAILAGSNFLTNHTPNYPDAKTMAQAVELFYAVEQEGNYYFVKTFPTNYSMHEKSNYSALTKAITGSLPVEGSSVDDLIGKPVMLNLANEDKVSKAKNTPYTITKVTDKPMPVPVAMVDQAPDAVAAIEAFEAEIARQEAEGEDQSTEDQPPF